ncbi:MAG: MurR/RpiR family transcriptional regulator [Ardenticatenaceae bacterium]|nr:MurR/RpiR family transcriptional regulator [Ardenticatenaceae bacterium]
MDTARDDQDIEARIRTAYDSLSDGQKKIAELALTRPSEAVYSPAARIAELVGVSHSTVVRTAQALGYAGFPEFQAALQEWFLGRVSTVDRFQFSSRQFAVEKDGDLEGDATAVLRRVMLDDAAHIEGVLQQISAPDFERAVEMVDSARRVYVVGLRASASLALNFGLALRHIRPDCFLLQQGFGDLPDQLFGISEDDLLVVMSYGRYMRDTLRCMDHARAVGARVLAITDSILSPAARRADVALVVPANPWFYVMSAAVHSFMSALLVAVALRRKDDARRRVERLDEIFQQFHLFEKQDERDIVSQIERKGPS